MARRALVMVDIQNDFMPGGPLAVPDGDAVVPVAARLAERIDLVVATQDWHPPGHGSFASQHAGKAPFDVGELSGVTQVLWPDHCVQGTKGADFVEGVPSERIAAIFRKGTDPTVDSYSGFFDNEGRHTTGLAGYLKELEVTDVYLVGVATDVCVKHTALDARRLGFATFVVRDGCRAVEATPGDGARAIEAMRATGARVVEASDVARVGSARGAASGPGVGAELQDGLARRE